MAQEIKMWSIQPATVNINQWNCDGTTESKLAEHVSSLVMSAASTSPATPPRVRINIVRAYVSGDAKSPSSLDRDNVKTRVLGLLSEETKTCKINLPGYAIEIHHVESFPDLPSNQDNCVMIPHNEKWVIFQPDEPVDENSVSLKGKFIEVE
jgi:hypothetical protein